MSIAQSDPIVTPVVTSESDLRYRVVASLWASNMPGLRRIVVEIKDQTVTLRGQVTSFYERQTALARVDRVPGVDRIIDKLRVRSA